MIGAPATPACVYLVRHGETEWSQSRQHTGRTDIALTAHGETQARNLAPGLQAVRFTSVLSSPSLRARRTCELAGLGAGAVMEPDLFEWHYGDYEGQRTAETHRLHPNWNLFRDGCPNGETPEEVSDRADRLVARLRREGGRIALFSHGQIGAVLAVRWIGLPLIEARHFPLETASVSILGDDPHHPEQAILVLWNAPLAPPLRSPTC